MISRARMQYLAREKGLTTGAVEKDYVNSWVLYAVFTSQLKDVLVFKGGTALSKLYFPETWRFSEDLDFTAVGEFDQKELEKSLLETREFSGIGFEITSVHENPGFVRIKVQYQAGLGHKNSTLVEISLQEPLVFPVQELNHEFEDVPAFQIKAYSLEEILVEKLRSLFQRARARDYYDLFYLLESSSFANEIVLEKLKEKCKARGVELDLVGFPDEERIEEIRAYWDSALDQLTSQKPEFDEVVERIVGFVHGLAEVDGD